MEIEFTDYEDYVNEIINNTSLPYVNITEHDLSSHLPAHVPYALTVMSLVVYVLVLILGIPGNGVVIWMAGFEMKKTVNTVWFLNLAIADFLCCLMAPFSIMLLLLEYQWPLGPFACKVIPSVYLLNMYTSVLLLTAISIDRCMLVTRPVWCQNHRTVWKATVASLLLWILALLMTSPSLIYRKVNSNNSRNISYCGTHYGDDPAQAQNVETFVAVYRFLCGFVLPFITITFCYSLLVMKVSRSRFNRANKMLKMIFAVIVGFFVCWFPYHVAGLLLATNSKHTEIYKSTRAVDPLLVSIAFLNSCINPLIYVIMGQDFKEKFQKSIKTVLRNILTEDQSNTYSESRKTKSTTEDRQTDTVV